MAIASGMFNSISVLSVSCSFEDQVAKRIEATGEHQPGCFVLLGDPRAAHLAADIVAAHHLHPAHSATPAPAANPDVACSASLHRDQNPPVLTAAELSAPDDTDTVPSLCYPIASRRPLQQTSPQRTSSVEQTSA